MKANRTIWAMAAAAVAAAGASWAAPTADEEFAFASALITYEPAFKDYAQKVVDNLLARDPSQEERSLVIQGQLHVAAKNYDKAQALVDRLGVQNPRAQAIMLPLALGYYNSGDQAKSVALFDQFFGQYPDGKTPEDPDVARFYQTAAFNYASIREAMDDWAGAAGCYKRVEQAADSKGLAREMQYRQAQAWVKAAQRADGEAKEKALAEADAICKKITWGGLDVTFVNAIVVMADAQMARGRPDQAAATLKEYMANIKQVDEMLKEEGESLKNSPMAGARFLLGSLLKAEAEKLEASGDQAGALAKYAEALNEYYNVFVKYGDGPNGPAAGMESKAIKEILETRFGKTVKIDLPANMAAKAAGTEFAMADNLFRQKKYGDAEKEYLRVLGQFPESGELSVKAVANLLQCYVYQNDPLMAKATADYLGERMNKLSPLAAKGVLAAGELYRKAENDEMRDWMFETYLKRCPDDEQAGAILFFMSSLAEKAGDEQRANSYLNKIITEHPQDAKFPLAISKQAWKAYGAGDYQGAIKGLVHYLKETQGQPSPLRAQAMFALADCLRRTKRAEMAVKQFDMLVSSLGGENAKQWGSSAADQAKNATLLEQGSFWRAYTLAQMDAEAQRREGVKQFGDFLSKYPQSQMAPKALKAMGSAQMALKDPAANETYARLARDYPNTDEGKNAQYARISGALEMNQYDQAKEAANAMIASAGSFKPEEFLRVGAELLEHEIYPEAAGAYQQVVNRSQERGLLERAYFGLGKARHGAGDDHAAVEALNELMNRWPKSSLFYDAKFVLAEANLKLGDMAAAKDALNSILRYADKADVNNEASLLMAKVQLGEGDKAGAAQTYQRLEYLNLLNMPTEKERAQMRKALLEAMALEEDMGDDARLQETADAFLENFPMAQEVAQVQKKRDAAKLRLAASVGADGGDGDAAE